MSKPLVLLSALVLALPGCASTGAAYPDVPRDEISREMLEEAETLDAFQVIRRYRPMWLRANRGQDSFAAQGRRGVRVYVDAVATGGMGTLRELQANVIESIQFLDKRESTIRFGTDHAEGAILVTTRRGGR